ncbi:hypothetical protein [Falsirhodobacter sp. 20TX0035]|uniref:hypothetical protein n=1 Tax=Falsirhodobacter sp. 20TX0035 TaxID=3022019 RepID=UPI0023306E0A|nr:hypothetical protein [Falsirhodobacter sp. 20TX0035]MDB6455112.1 hypothetical protein [Falsirhodobacter sp. 20TX0035]
MANVALLVTMREAGAAVLQTITGLRCPWLDVKRINWAGVISITFDGSMTWEPLDLSDV